MLGRAPQVTLARGVGPHLRGQPDVLARDLGLAQPLPHLHLVAVHPRGVIGGVVWVAAFLGGAFLATREGFGVGSPNRRTTTVTLAHFAVPRQ